MTDLEKKKEEAWKELYNTFDWFYYTKREDLCHNIVHSMGFDAGVKATQAEIDSLKAENEKLKSAFDDRCRVIEMQLQDKKDLKQLVEEAELLIRVLKFNIENSEIFDKDFLVDQCLKHIEKYKGE